eukprot:6489392-Amphidinium_carterae.1
MANYVDDPTVSPSSSEFGGCYKRTEVLSFPGSTLVTPPNLMQVQTCGSRTHTFPRNTFSCESSLQLARKVAPRFGETV